MASNVLGVSGRAILERLVAGETDPVALAGEARQCLRDKRPALEAALRGSAGPHQQFLLGQQLAHIEQLEGLLAATNAEITRRLRADTDAPTAPAPNATPPATGSAASAVLGGAEVGTPAAPPALAETATPPRSAGEAILRLDTIPGVGPRVAEVLIAEIGRDMSRFPSAAHLASWAGLCPGHHESGGKRLSGRTRTGHPTLRATLIEAARAAAKTHTYLATQFHRLAARRDGKRAAVAVAHSILTIAFHLLRDGGSIRTSAPPTTTSGPALALPSDSSSASVLRASPSSSAPRSLEASEGFHTTKAKVEHAGLPQQALGEGSTWRGPCGEGSPGRTETMEAGHPPPTHRRQPSAST